MNSLEDRRSSRRWNARPRRRWNWPLIGALALNAALFATAAYAVWRLT